MKKIFLGILVLLLSPVVNAANIELNGVSSLKTGENSKFEIKLKDVAEEFNQVEFTIEYDGNLIKFLGGSEDYGTSEKYSGNSGIIISSEDFKNGVIGSISLTNLSNEYASTNVVIKDINFKKNGELVASGEVYTKTLTLKQGTTTTTRVLNTSAEITGISFKNATMKPAFSAKTKEYKIYVKDTIRQLTLSYNSKQSGVSLKGECNLNCSISDSSDNVILINKGKNEVNYTFTSEDGKSNESYKFIIYRGETNDGSNKLGSLVVKDFNINEEFDEDKLDYTISVPFEVESLEIDARALDEEATVKVKGNEALKVGENIITITVIPTDSDNDLNIYNITVTREEFVPEEVTTSRVNPAAVPKKNNTTLIVIIVVVGLVIIGVSAYFIFFFKKKDIKADSPKEDVDSAIGDEKNIIDDTFVGNESVEDALDDLMKTKNIFDDNEKY